MSRIVVGVEGSAHAERALRWAVKEAQLIGATVEVVHGYVVRPRAGALVYDERESAEAVLDAVVERNRAVLDRTTWTSTVVPTLWSPAGALMDLAEGADLVVVGSRGLGGFKELLLGSTSYRTASHASAPVAVIRGDAATEDLDGRRGIVVGVDESRAGRRALRWALDEAVRRGVSLTVVHAYSIPVNWSLAGMVPDDALDEYRTGVRDAAIDMVDRAIAELDAPPDVDVQPVVAGGMAAAVLLDHAGEDRLLVVGTHGRGGLGRAVLGSVSHQCLHHATGPVVVVP